MRLKLIERKPETSDVETFVFEPSEPLTWKAGQFLHYVLHHEPTDSRGSDRWFTVSSAPYEKKPMITTRFNDEKSSTFKDALKAMKIGDLIEVADIDGDFIAEDSTRNHIFIAGGIGITPFHSILKEADHAGQKLKVILMYANRDENVVFKKELEDFASRNPNLKINYFIGDRIDEKAIRETMAGVENPYFYISGPEPMVEAFGKMLRGMGIAEKDIRQDWFPGYPME